MSLCCGLRPKRGRLGAATFVLQGVAQGGRQAQRLAGLRDEHDHHLGGEQQHAAARDTLVEHQGGGGGLLDVSVDFEDLVDAGGFEGTTICCAYVSSPDSELSTLSLKKHLSQVLPHYMLPVRWMALDRMPQNGNGKTDRPWLKEQFRHQAVPNIPSLQAQPMKEAPHVA